MVKLISKIRKIYMGGESCSAAEAQAGLTRRPASKKSAAAFPRSAAAAALFAAGAYFSAAGNAEAGAITLPGTTCTMAAGAFASVTIGNMAHAPDITVPLNMTCNLTDAGAKVVADNPDRQVSYCFHIHNNICEFSYRSAVSPTFPGSFPGIETKGNMPKYTFPYILFNFYGDGGSRKIGSNCINPIYQKDQYNIIGRATKVTDKKYTLNDSIILRFENNLGRVIKPGVYSLNSIETSDSKIHGGITLVKTNSNAGWEHPYPYCADSDDDATLSHDVAMTGAVILKPTIKISVSTYCKMSVPAQATFPVSPSLKDVKPITATLNVDCSAGTHFKVESDMGRHPVGNQRYMKAQNSDATIAYDLDTVNSLSPTYTPDSAEPLRKWTDWGNGTPAGIDYNFQFSIVPGQKTPADDTYQDTIIFTLDHIAESGDITDPKNMAGYTVQ